MIVASMIATEVSAPSATIADSAWHTAIDRLLAGRDRVRSVPLPARGPRGSF